MDEDDGDTENHEKVYRKTKMTVATTMNKNAIANKHLQAQIFISSPICWIQF